MSTINIVGTGGIIEGNLGAANVNVNLDQCNSFSETGYKMNSTSYFTSNFDDVTIMFWATRDDLTDTTSDRLFTANGGNDLRIYLQSDVLRFRHTFADDSVSEACQFNLTNEINNNDWFHIAAVYDGSGGIDKLFLNGVQKASVSVSQNLKALSSATDAWSIARRVSTTAESYAGKIADCKIYSTALSEAEIKIAASKINKDPTLISSTAPVGYWPIVGTTIDVTDNSSNSNNMTALGTPTVTYDKFSVDVYDGSDTSTTGTFTVTQGKVEGKALTSGLFDGDDDFVELGSQSGDLRLYNSDAAISVWFKPHDGNAGDSHKRILDKSDGGSAVGGYAILFHTDGINGRISGYMDNVAVIPNVEPTGGFVDNRFYHILWTWDGTNHNIYIDGVLEKTVASSARPPSDTTGMRIGSWNHSTAREFDGNIRDVKIFDYAFSAEQAASIYSGTYPQTALHQYKLDEGSGTTATDSGTSSTLVNGVMTNGATYTNGTLDLNSPTTDQLRISANGTLSAPRGNLAIGGAISATVNSFENYGTFIHNNGTVTFDATADYGQRIQETAAAATAFYNLTHNRSASSYHLYIKGDITVENTLLNQVGFVNLYGPNTLTMGTTSSAGAMTMTSSGIRFYNNDSSNYAKIYGASSIYPFVYTGNEPDIDTYSTNASHVAFKNGDIQVAMTSDYQGGIVRLDGDMEFDAVTVNSGDTLDLNGQRIECSNSLSILGTCDLDNALIYMTGVGILNDDGTDQNAGTCTLVQQGTSTTVADPPSGVGTFLYNQPSVTQIIGKLANVHIFGAGTQTITGNPTGGDLTIATGANMNATDDTITVTGDFTTSGGLIGKSALNLTGSEEVTGTDNLDEVATSNRVTVEAWFKATTDANYRAIFSRGTSWSTGNIYMYMNSAGNVQFSMNDLGATVTSTTAGLADGKWHHAAATYDQTNLKLYIDGKLEASSAYTNALNTQSNGFKIGDRDGDNWVGQIGRVSIWDAALTEAQIREMLFYDFATADSEGTIPDANCIGWWQFDEGTGTAVADSSTNNADGTLNSAAWAGAGTFTRSTSTVKLTGNGSASFAGTSTEFHNLEVASSGKTTTFVSVGGDDKRPVIRGTLTHGGGTLTTSTNCSIDIGTGGTVSSGTDTSALYFTRWYSTTAVPALTSKYLSLQANVDLAGDQTNTQYIQFYNNHNTFDFNITTNRIISYANSNVTMGAGTIEFTSTTGWGSNVYDNRVFTAGPGATIKGVGAKSGFASGPNWEVVGDVINLDVTNEELVVAGTVTNCTGDIIQWHHSHDYDQKLDADTADDRDIKLGGPALDNANALNT